MSIELKIKAKHLALEPAIIRHEERKLKQHIKRHRSDDKTSAFHLQWKLFSLTDHRKQVVRKESRATHLARTFLAGKPYTSVERKRRDDYYFNEYIVPRIVAMVTKYGVKEQRKATKETILEWAKL